MQDKEIQEHSKSILSNSEKRLLALKLLANFFKHHDLLAVYVKTKVIHGLFDSNSTLDINKLELFHVQYTDTLIGLFQKLKKSKEVQYNLLSNEYYLNQDIIAKLESERGDDSWLSETKIHAQYMSRKLEQLYQILAFGDRTKPFSWSEVTAFTAQKWTEFYRPVSDAQWRQLTSVPLKKSYANQYITIESRLLTRLSNLNFKIKFRCGLSNNNNIIEIFEFRDSNDLFAATHTDRQFFLLSAEQVAGIDLSRNKSSKNQIIAQLQASNASIKEQLATVKTSVAPDVAAVLASYLEKISDIRFLDDLQNVDEQTNILRAMLNININSK